MEKEKKKQEVDKVDILIDLWNFLYYGGYI